MPGISEPISQQSCPKRSEDSVIKEVRFNDIRPISSKKVNAITEAFELAVKRLGLIPVGIKKFPLEKIHENKAKLKNFDLDVALLATGISVEDPLNDVRLMFSFEGIFLPDTDGRIQAELDKGEINVQAINELIYDQNVIIPISRYDLGIWARKGLNLEDYNTLLPLGALQWIGSR